MDKVALYQSIRLIMKAGLLECPTKAPICDMCIYHDFCSAVVGAVHEARKLAETDAVITGIMDEAYEQRQKEIIERGE